MFACRVILVNLRYTIPSKVDAENTLLLQLIYLVRESVLDERASKQGALACVSDCCSRRLAFGVIKH
jgi:hypothetical protein